MPLPPDAIPVGELPADAVPVAEPKGPGFADRALNMIGRGAYALPGLVGLDYETANAGLSALTDPNELGGDFGDRFRKYRGQYAKLSRTVDQDAPVTSGLVRGVSAAPGEALLWATAPQVKLAQTASALQKALAFGPRLGTLAGMSEYGSTAHKDAGDRAAGAAAAGAAGTVLGGAMGAALPNPMVLSPRYQPGADPEMVARLESKANTAAVARAQAEASGQGGGAAARTLQEITVEPPPARTLANRVLGEPAPVPEARYLMERGVQLPRGKYDPRSALAQQEIASQSLPVVGPQITAQNRRALEQAMDLVYQEARPPGTAPLRLGGDINERFSALDGAWNQAYEAFKREAGSMYPAIIDGDSGVRLIGTRGAPGAVDLAVGDRGIIATDSARKSVYDFIRGQFSKVHSGRGEGFGRESVADLLDIRSTIRKELRNQIRRQSKDGEADLLGAAERQITQAIESQIPPELAARLKELDGNYRSFKAVEQAVYGAGDNPAGLTPQQLAMAVRSVESSKNAYATGGGGPLRDLSKSIRTVFDESISPPTGQRLLTLAPEWVNRLNAGKIVLRNQSAVGAQGGSAGARSSAAGAASAEARALEQAMRRGMGGIVMGSHSPSPAAMALIEALKRQAQLGSQMAAAEDETR